MESDATPCYPVGLVSSGISSVVTPDEDRVANMDTEYVKKFGPIVARGTKRNPQKWVVKKHGSQVDEVHMTQFIGFVVAKN